MSLWLSFLLNLLSICLALEFEHRPVVVESLIYHYNTPEKSSHSPSISVHQDTKPLVDPEGLNLSHVMYFNVELGQNVEWD